MSVVDLGTHAELEARRGYHDPTGCEGRMMIRSQLGSLIELECEACGFDGAIPAREVDATPHASQALERRRERSGIPAELRGLVLPADGSDLARAVSAWARGTAEHRGLTLTGDVGVGKTHTAAAAAWERMTLGALRWFSVPILFAQLGRAFSDEGRHEALDALIAGDALVLDDVDKTRPSEYAAEQLFCAIDARITAGAALLITTNLALSTLAERFPEPYGEAIVSRLAGYSATFRMLGADRRTQRRAA